MDFERNDPSSIWIDDAKLAMYQGNLLSARTMYEVALSLRPQDSSLWEEYLNLENTFGDQQKYKAVLQRAAESGGVASEVFVLQLAKKLLAAGQIEESERHMAVAVEKNPSNDQLVLGYIELLKRIGKISKCREMLQVAKNLPGSKESVFRYAIRFEREQAQPESALKEAREASQRFPNSSDISCDLATALEEVGRYDKARDEYQSLGRDQQAQKNHRVWTQWIALEDRTGGPARARVVFEKAKMCCPNSEEIWLAGIAIEENFADPKIIKPLLAESIKECPQSGALRAKFIEYEPLSTRIKGISEATKQLINNPFLMNLAAKTFWHENKHEKAKTWFENSLKVDTKLGDSWAWYYLFLEETKQDSSGLISRCLEAEPTRGPFWTRVSSRPENWNKSSAELLLMTRAEVQRDHMRIKR